MDQTDTTEQGTTLSLEEKTRGTREDKRVKGNETETTRNTAGNKSEMVRQWE